MCKHMRAYMQECLRECIRAYTHIAHTIFLITSHQFGFIICLLTYMCKIAIADYAVTQVVTFFKFIYVIYLHITWHIMKTIIKSL